MKSTRDIDIYLSYVLIHIDEWLLLEECTRF